MTRPRMVLRGAGAFSLMELLIVIAIIGILAAISFPAMKNVGKSSEMSSGVRQVLDDLTLARQKAIDEQTTVHFVFVPRDMMAVNYTPNAADPRQRDNATMVMNLMTASYRGYAIYSLRTAGDQPGRPTMRYVTEWQRLPDGVVFQTDQYQSLDPDMRSGIEPNVWDRPFQTNTYPFPTVYGEPNILPFVGFDAHGSLVDQNGERLLDNEYVDLARGSILAPRDDQGQLLDFDVREVKEGPRKERFARIEIDAFSGRARIMSMEELNEIGAP